MITTLFVESGDTKPDKDLIYLKKATYPLKRILEWYFDAGKKILDVTAGERKTWNATIINNETLPSGDKLYDITFLDSSRDAKTDVVADFRKIPFPDDSFDIIYFDPPFMRLSNARESFGIRQPHTFRPFYFRQNDERFIPPEAYFFQTWKEFNRISKNGLIVKISERYENLREIPVTTYMDLAYDNIFNKNSNFKRCVKIGYRGWHAGMGAKMIHAQRVLTYFVVYKKNLRQR